MSGRCGAFSEVLPSLTRGQNQAAALMALQARLLGISGLLPADLPRGEPVASQYLQRIWNVWWREREQFADLTLPRSMWRLSGLRPANHPQRRLALAAHWLARADLPARLERWFADARPGRKLARSLLEVLASDSDEFWSNHWTFQSARIRAAKPLIGPPRVTDLAMNVIFPLVLDSRPTRPQQRSPAISRRLLLFLAQIRGQRGPPLSHPPLLWNGQTRCD